ncbi:MAG: EamA family transporter RarD [Planctomycetota bacterium]|nr:EamA family transporter RarD [Planctomycetota bacterium]
MGGSRELMSQNNSDRDLKGWLNALTAFGWWGLVLPLALLWAKSEGSEEIGSSVVRWTFELLSLRILFCLVFCLVLLLSFRRFGLLLEVFRSRSLLLWFCLSSFLIFLNWLGFIIGASMNNLSQASLGYYMGPLFNVLLGFLFLSERLKIPQFVAVCIAGMGILWLTLKAGEFPWIALCLATSFGFYGLVRKKIKVDAVVGLTMESLFCIPIAVGVLVFLGTREEGLVFLNGSILLKWIVIALGPATAIPLICFAKAANRLRLGTLGFIQFIAPTGQLLLAVLFDTKPITGEKLVGYCFVWLAVGVYLVDLWFTQKNQELVSIDKLES